MAVHVKYLSLTWAEVDRIVLPMSKKRSRNRVRPLQVRLTIAELKLFKSAADFAGLSVSGWVRERLIANARRELSSPRENTSK